MDFVEKLKSHFEFCRKTEVPFWRISSCVSCFCCEESNGISTMEYTKTFYFLRQSAVDISSRLTSTPKTSTKNVLFWKNGSKTGVLSIPLSSTFSTKKKWGRRKATMEKAKMEKVTMENEGHSSKTSHNCSSVRKLFNKLGQLNQIRTVLQKWPKKCNFKTNSNF